MKRKIYNKLIEWKKTWNGKTAILIDGARRVGKSWIAEEFARKEYKSYIKIDFSSLSNEAKEVFDSYLQNLDEFFLRLSLVAGIKLYPRESVIIFDEVQLYPQARQAIKHLVADGRYDYIETGSLVSINHNVTDIVIPSEEERINMYPMDFEEFMWAIDETDLYDFGRRQFESLKPLGNALHRKLLDYFRLYMVVGGMPQAVESYIEKEDFNLVDKVKRAILNLYRNDISKYAGRQAPIVTRVFDNIPNSLQKHEKRFRPSQIKKGGRTRDFEEAMFWLDESRVANFCYACTEPSVGLSLNKDESKLKIYLSDTGLLISMEFDEENIEKEEIYKKMILGKIEFNKGMLTENVVAQLLLASGHPLYFYSTSSSKDTTQRMEIDFLIRKKSITNRHNISAIEVKSGTNFTTNSLRKFKNKFDAYLNNSYILSTKDLEVKDNIIYLPIYMAGML